MPPLCYYIIRRYKARTWRILRTERCLTYISCSWLSAEDSQLLTMFEPIHKRVINETAYQT